MEALATLPSKVDMRSACPPVYDQGQLGSCTGNAIAGAMEFDLKKENPKTEFAPSRLFIYYNERVIEGTVKSDSGAQIRDGIKSVAAQGAPHEALWPYNIADFAEKPPQTAYDDAAKHEATLYQRLVQSLTQMKGCLAAGSPFVFGFTVYASFEGPDVAKTGIVPMPARHEKMLGGHAVLAVGYDDSQQRFIVRNSWGPAWGDKGYFTIPYIYLLDEHLSSDFWTIKFVK
jgi:C1A family cysteine protease